ncbi:hypothetical protein ACHSBP_06785 [Pseudoalteromonas sp. XMcav1-K]|uniref:hypothetical protein n=1 Tax=Pseudoalteromonas sp. XMcav1-K TaxID=3374372 RepID=UPI003756CE5C
MKSYISIFILMCVSFQLKASFELPGSGTVIYPSGLKQEFSFGFKWDKQNKLFTIGNQEYPMDQMPDSYSIALTLAGDDQAVFVQEFANGYISEFEWRLGPHIIKLEKKRLEYPVRGDYILWIDQYNYFLKNGNPSVKIVFNKDGINYIIPSGITKDNGRRR